MARLWRDAVNRHGGDVRRDPPAGDRHQGQYPLPMSDLNNVQIADLVSQFLKDKQLD
jgi:hypothetical protein